MQKTNRCCQGRLTGRSQQTFEVGNWKKETRGSLHDRGFVIDSEMIQDTPMKKTFWMLYLLYLGERRHRGGGVRNGTNVRPEEWDSIRER